MELYDNKYRVSSVRLPKEWYDKGIYFVTICTKDHELYFGTITDETSPIMTLTELGKEVERNIEIMNELVDIQVLEHVVMPNHVHLLISIGNKEDTSRRDEAATRLMTENAETANHADVRRVEASSLPQYINIDTNTSNPASRRDEAVTRLMKGNAETSNHADVRRVEASSLHGKTTMANISAQNSRLSRVVASFKSAITKYARQNNAPFGWQPRYHEHVVDMRPFINGQTNNQFEQIQYYIRNNIYTWVDDRYHVKGNL